MSHPTPNHNRLNPGHVAAAVMAVVFAYSCFKNFGGHSASTGSASTIEQDHAASPSTHPHYDVQPGQAIPTYADRRELKFVLQCAHCAGTGKRIDFIARTQGGRCERCDGTGSLTYARYLENQHRDIQSRPEPTELSGPLKDMLRRPAWSPAVTARERDWAIDHPGINRITSSPGYTGTWAH